MKGLLEFLQKKVWLIGLGDTIYGILRVEI